MTLALATDRVAHCGTIWETYIGANGQLKRRSRRCGDFRNCPKCKEWEVELGKNRLRRIVIGEDGTEDNGVAWFILDSVAKESLRRKLGKANYWSKPRGNGIYNVFTVDNGAKVDGRQPVEIIKMSHLVDGAYTTLDWTDLFINPAGTKQSGLLGKEPKRAGESITLNTAVIDASNEEVEEIFQEANEWSKDPNTAPDSHEWGKRISNKWQWFLGLLDEFNIPYHHGTPVKLYYSDVENSVYVRDNVYVKNDIQPAFPSRQYMKVKAKVA